jgi:hypothetical protein
MALLTFALFAGLACAGLIWIAEQAGRASLNTPPDDTPL